MNNEEISEYKVIPGRGLVTKNAIQVRLDYLSQNGFELENISRYFLDHALVKNNIESFIGTVEIPLGIVGPLLFDNNGTPENVYTAAGTLEGALVASMNRGAKAISLSKGFKAKVVRQKMVRAPLFILSANEEAMLFEAWVKANFGKIKEVAEAYSNHAKLISLSIHRFDRNVHVRFVYTTGDASGQNMTTTCTWHAMLFIVESFLKEKEIEIPYFVIEGNGSSDKKVSQYLIDQGRGISVEAECFLEESVIRKVLRTSSEDLARCFDTAIQLAKEDGMIGFNVNVANTVASIFVATGQDLASIHESSIGQLVFERRPNGLQVHLTLPSLVIGTIGGGTNLPEQNEGLRIMNCAGNGKVERFAQLIAGFALSLEISTSAAIASGEFAKAHEKLGRNKPVSWLVKNELNAEFLKNCLHGHLNGIPITSIRISEFSVENGILTNITQRVNKKLTGFIPINIQLANGKEEAVLIKSKALDIEVIKGLHLMAASIDPKLSDLIYRSKEDLEYWNCHLKELLINEVLSDNGFDCIPRFFGKYINETREIYFLFQEKLDRSELLNIDSENSPQAWTRELICNCIDEISKVHIHFLNKENQQKLLSVTVFEPWRALPFYKKIASIVCEENSIEEYRLLDRYIGELGERRPDHLPLTLIHNDFNPRNVAVRKNGKPCIYDWELAVLDIPHRDIVEFLCFVMPLDFDPATFLTYLDHHHSKTEHAFAGIDRKEWFNGYRYALKEFLVTRAAYYKAAEILFKLKFADRIMLNAIRMIKFLEEDTDSA